MFYSQLEKSWMESRVSHDLISLLTNQVSKIVPLPTRTSIYSHDMDLCIIPRLEEFIDIITRRSRTRTGTVLVALILLTRLSQRLGFVTTTGLASAPQRIFLASLIISTKLIHDTSPKNKHWLNFANGYFELDEINLMEKQFLTLMDFNLSVSDYDFAHVVDRYQQLQKDKCHYINKTKYTPDYLISPNRNVALVNKNPTTVTRHSRPSSASSSTSSLVLSLSASSSSSSSSSSSLLTLSLSSTPIISNNNNLSSTCDTDMKKTWCYPTKCKSPLFSA